MKRVILAVALPVILTLAFGLLLLTGRVALNHPAQPVHGVDVSHYQGEIDWPLLAEQDIRFAFVKATEGSGFADGTFEANWSGARAAGLRTGAYHFFSYDSPAERQAANFISRVPVEADALPPVIDVEFYGDYAKHPAPTETVVQQLREMVDALAARYGTKPILYATGRAYRLYLAQGFDDCDIWIRSVYTEPKLPDGRAWTFWQYTDKGRLRGTHGVEEAIDLNVFRGTEAEFEAYPRRQQ